MVVNNFSGPKLVSPEQSCPKEQIPMAVANKQKGNGKKWLHRICKLTKSRTCRNVFHIQGFSFCANEDTKRLIESSTVAPPSPQINMHIHTVVCFSLSCFTMLCDWSRKSAPTSQPIRCKTETNRDLATRVFPRLRRVTCIYFEF